VPDLNRAQALKAIADAGYCFVEAYCDRTQSRIGPSVVFAEQVLDDLAHFGLALSGLNISDITVGCSLTGLKLEIDYAASLGAKNVNVRGGHRTERDMNALLNCLKVLSPFALSRGVNINIRNSHGNRVETLDDIRAVFSMLNAPALGMALDAGQFWSSKISPLDASALFPERTRSIYTPVQLGRATVGFDQAALISGLAGKGFDGFVVVEQEGRAHNLARHLKEMRLFIEGILRPDAT